MERVHWRWLLAGVFVGLAAGIIAFYGLPESVDDGDSRQQALADELGALEAGSEAPDFAVETVDGELFRLSDHRGQVVLLNFWATWCGPCEIEMPLLEEQHQRGAAEGFLVAGVNAGEPRRDVISFGERLGLTFPLLLDSDEQVQGLYRIRAYPTSVLVDSQGRIGKVHFGVLTESQLTEYLAELGVGS